MRTLSSPEDVKKQVEGLVYHARDPHRVSSAAVTLERGWGHCTEGMLVAAMLMEHLGHRPQPMFIRLDGRDGEITGHWILPYQKGSEFFSIGLSRYPETCGRDTPYESHAALADSYYKPFLRQGYEMTRWDLYDLGESLKPWRDSRADFNVEWEFLSGLCCRS
jgi:hypothetical protein